MPSQTEHLVRVRRPLDAGGRLEDAVEAAAPWAQRYVEYALLAAVVYRNNEIKPQGDWKLQDQFDHPQSGLYYEVFDSAARQETAIVFRGTNGVKDWWSNARFLTQFIPLGWGQYETVRARISTLVQAARQRMPGGALMTTGHSLGGGLAQQAAYAVPDIKKVIAFDPSPLTGFRSVPEPARSIHAKGIKIERVYEKGEILAFLRGPLRRFVPLDNEDPSIIEVRFNLTTGRAVAEHSMTDLALKMAALAQVPTAQAAAVGHP